MTDREAAAGLVAKLQARASTKTCRIGDFEYRSEAYALDMEAATLITTLLSELERVGKELSEFRELYAREARKNIVIAESQSAAEARAFIEKAKS